jgi:hypothetical protein
MSVKVGAGVRLVLENHKLGAPIVYPVPDENFVAEEDAGQADRSQHRAGDSKLAAAAALPRRVFP